MRERRKGIYEEKVISEEQKFGNGVTSEEKGRIWPGRCLVEE
jgi:hypothetical protein